MSAEEQLAFDIRALCEPTSDLANQAAWFCATAPHRQGLYGKRNWGGQLHSLCSYQGKLKPSIAYFLVNVFTERGQRVLDPLAGVGTVPLEARRQGRVGIANDLSPLGACVCRAKLELFTDAEVEAALEDLAEAIDAGPSLSDLTELVDVDWGLNNTIRDYFHPETLRELLIARSWFLDRGNLSVADEVVRSSLLHILHGNRPYALSRRSHPVTPLAPTGPVEYKSVVAKLVERLVRISPALHELSDPAGPSEVHGIDFRDLSLSEPVDAVITSPPFAQSFRFWSMNWMRLWFVGWTTPDFAKRPAEFLELQQRKSFDPYAEFSTKMAELLRPGGLLIMHLGETAKVDMAKEIVPKLAGDFDVCFVGRECVADTESHGLTDKGATLAHWYVFASRR